MTLSDTIERLRAELVLLIAEHRDGQPHQKSHTLVDIRLRQDKIASIRRRRGGTVGARSGNAWVDDWSP